MAAAAILKNRKILKYRRNRLTILTKFGVLMQLDLLDSISQ